MYELGLIYDIAVEPINKVWNPSNTPTGNKCHVLMTLTTAWCPEAQSIPEWVKEAVLQVEGIDECDVEITFDPPWTQECISENGKLELGLL